MGDDKCHGCDGKGWIQVIDPPVYQHKGAGNTAPVLPYCTSTGTARAVICPICEGTGRRKKHER
jgi:DnaJ-class molecular chaperone